ncbi:4'-phosphopantetheinyl transferase superfamily protein [Rhodobacter sp. SGA-6-6]|uniref:4'-phosphopantetheinyl transferase family protein n=1 Tax=Rhodobacter sp. SGA-6-6 TaxID=2710882 RepID=UPI0013EC446E|nr:4'-phosphopantetheinyl transferase superfamily protein [Rhodobacter sp. SGA-6-6]NGM44050.1 4'-phosphopantetheinyl transferase superfamily protein [Rhodobacter sp. SGA-6-6]
MPDAALTALARQLLPPGTAVAAADPARLWPLLAGEAPPAAVPARLAEFSAGRHAARAALQALGLPPAAIPMAADRAPVWPKGVAGSITHTRRACLAAARRGGGLGIDLEEDEDLPADLWDSVLLPEEQDWARGQAAPGRAAKLAFSAKEAAYKAQYARSRRLFGFDTLALSFHGDGFTATFRAAAAPFAMGDRLQGRWGRAAGHVLTVVAL